MGKYWSIELYKVKFDCLALSCCDYMRNRIYSHNSLEKLFSFIDQCVVTSFGCRKEGEFFLSKDDDPYAMELKKEVIEFLLDDKMDSKMLLGRMDWNLNYKQTDLPAFKALQSFCMNSFICGYGHQFKEIRYGLAIVLSIEEGDDYDHYHLLMPI